MVLADIGTMAQLIYSSVSHTKITSFLGVFLVYIHALRFKRAHRLKPVVFGYKKKGRCSKYKHRPR